MPASADDLRGKLSGPLSKAGLDLEDVQVQRAGRRELVRVVIDRDGGIDLDTVAESSALISEVLDAEPVASWFDTTYVLEVSSPGVDRPLTEVRHWRRATGRLVQATLGSGEVVLGRVVRVDATAGQVLLATDQGDECMIDVGHVRHAQVQIEFNRSSDDIGVGDAGDGRAAGDE